MLWQGKSGMDPFPVSDTRCPYSHMTCERSGELTMIHWLVDWHLCELRGWTASLGEMNSQKCHCASSKVQPGGVSPDSQFRYNWL